MRELTADLSNPVVSISRQGAGLVDAYRAIKTSTVAYVPDQVGSVSFGAKAVVDRKRLLDAALDRAQRGAPLETVPGDWNSAAVGTVEDIRQGQIALLGGVKLAMGLPLFAPLLVVTWLVVRAAYRGRD